jgi:hypothetical protein
VDQLNILQKALPDSRKLLALGKLTKFIQIPQKFMVKPERV